MKTTTEDKIKMMRRALINTRDIASFRVFIETDKINTILKMSDDDLYGYFQTNVYKLLDQIRTGNLKKEIDDFEIFKKMDSSKEGKYENIAIRHITKRTVEGNWAVAYYILQNFEELGEAIKAKSLAYATVPFYDNSKSYGYVLNYDLDNYFKRDFNEYKFSTSKSSENQSYIYYRWKWGYEKFISSTASFVYGNSSNMAIKIDLKNAFPKLITRDDDVNPVIKNLLKVNDASHLGVMGISYGNNIESYYLANYLLVNFKYKFGKILSAKLKNAAKLVGISTYVDDNVIFLEDVHADKKVIEEMVAEASADLNGMGTDYELNMKKLDIYDQTNINEMIANRVGYGTDNSISEINIEDETEKTKREESYKIVSDIKNAIWEHFSGDLLHNKPKDNDVEGVFDCFYKEIDNKRIYKVFKFIFTNLRMTNYIDEIMSAINDRIKGSDAEKRAIHIYMADTLLKFTPEKISSKKYAIWLNSFKSMAEIGGHEPLKTRSFKIKPIVTPAFSGTLKNLFEIYIINTLESNGDDLDSLFINGDNDEDWVEKRLRKITAAIRDDKNSEEILGKFEKTIFLKDTSFYEIKSTLSNIFNSLVNEDNGLLIRRFNLALETAFNRADLFKNIVILYSNIKDLWTDDGRISPHFFTSWSESDEQYLENVKSIMLRSLVKQPKKRRSSYYFKRLEILLLTRNYINSLWKNGSRELEHFSNHGTLHSDNLTRYFEELSSYFDLKKSDYFPILLSILIHDAGLLDDNFVKNNPIFIKSIFELSNNSQSSYEELVAKYFGLRETMAMASRNEHGSRVKHIFHELAKAINFDKSALHAKNIDFALNASAIHNGNKDSEIMADERDEKPLFVLSLLDLMDLGFKRIGRPIINIGTSTASGYTKLFWIKDLIIDSTDKLFKVEETGNKITLVINYDDKTVKSISKIMSSEINDKYSISINDIEDGLVSILFNTELKWFDDNWRKKNGYWMHKTKLGISTSIRLQPIDSVRDMNYSDFTSRDKVKNSKWISQIALDKTVQKNVIKMILDKRSIGSNKY